MSDEAVRLIFRSEFHPVIVARTAKLGKWNISSTVAHGAEGKIRGMDFNAKVAKVCAEQRSAAKPQNWSADGPRPQHVRSEEAPGTFANRLDSWLLRTGTVRAPIKTLAACEQVNL